jgi:hypothetical protein
MFTFLDILKTFGTLFFSKTNAPGSILNSITSVSKYKPFSNARLAS